MTTPVLPVSSGAASTSTARTNVRAVVCGSFRRGLATLRTDFASLTNAGVEVLSPAGLDFVTERDGFVLLEHEVNELPGDVERRHLEALRASDFVWLHTPDGYVGPSGAFEIGVAQMAGVPVFAREAPTDATLANFVRVVTSIADAVVSVQDGLPESAGAPLEPLQRYYARAAARRGWDEEGPAESMLLLTEEVGELSRAVRTSIGLSRHGNAPAGHAAEELADIQLYLVHLANVLKVDLAAAVTAKEKENALRARRQVEAA